MLRPTFVRSVLVLFMALGLSRTSLGQVFPFTSGPIPLCDTSTFTANISGVGYLIVPDGWNWGPYLDEVVINITSDHPQTLQISLTSPAGTTLLLSEFNGAGGQNYTDTHFTDWAWNDITTASAPFSGYFDPQGGTLGTFAGENADGTWTITVIDTACANGGTGPGGTWTPGWFSGGAGSGAFAFGFSVPPPPCGTDMGGQAAYLCPGMTADILGYFVAGYDWGQGIAFAVYDQNGLPVVDPSSVSAPGWYSVNGTDWSGCPYWGSYEVISTPQILLGPDQVVDHCSGAGPVNLSALFSLSGVQQMWSLNGSFISSATAASATAPGVYRLIGANNGGCNDTAFISLTIIPDPAVGADQGVSVCPGGSVDLTALYATGGLSTTWTFGGVPFGTPAAATNAGIYTLVVSNADGCTDQAEVTLSVQAAGTLGADQVVDLCSDDTFDLTTLYNTTGMTAIWTLLGAPVPNPTAIITAGSYRLVVSNGTGCGDTAFVVVNTVAAPVLGPDASLAMCAGSAVDLTTAFNAAGLATTWTFSGSPVVDPTSVSAPGQYVLEVTNADGCTSSALVGVAISADPVLGSDQSVVACEGEVVDLTGLYVAGMNSMAWSAGGMAMDPASIVTSGTYTVTATNMSGCTASADVIVLFDPAPALGTDRSIDVCSDLSVDLTMLFNTAGLMTAWNMVNGTVLNPAQVNVTGTYQLVATNAAGCSDSAFVSVSMIALPTLGTSVSATACEGDMVDLTAYFDTTGLTTAWTFSGSVVGDPSAVSASGPYTLTASNADGCSASVTVDLTVAPNPVLGADQDVVECFGVPVDLTALDVTGANTTAWLLNGAPVADPTAVMDAGTYTLTATSAAGCEASAVVTLSLVPSPDMGADQQVQICSGSTFDLSTVFYSTGFSEVWTLNGAFVADPLSVDVTGDYRLVVANAAGCSDTAFVQLTVNDGPALGADLSFALCPWQSVDMLAAFAVGDVFASYTLIGEDVADPTLVTDAGVYVVTVIDANGCSDQATATVMNVECMCVADFDVEGRCMQDPMRFTLVADSVVLGAQWLFGDAAPATTAIDPTVMFRSEEDVRVTLRATLSCGVVDVERMIRIEDCSDSCTVWIPNAFTPNNDTWNDGWTWSGECEPEDFSVEVFDRWGELVFASKDPEKSWDGTFGGTASPSGVYAYRVGYRLPYQDRKEVMGSVTLVR